MDTRDPYQPIKSARLYEQMADQIKERIFNGELQEGDQLPNETELAERFGVSRTVVREAMKRLEQEGFVEVQRGRGTFVVYRAADAMRQSLGNLMEVERNSNWQALVEVRELLEPGIAALAALRAGEEHLADMQAAVDIMERSMDDADAYIQADNAFHLALARAPGNALLMTLIEPMMDLLSAQRKLIFRAPSGPQDGQHHHKCILRAIELRDPQIARECMESHMRQIRRDTGTQ